jgi:hypothetical protein
VKIVTVVTIVLALVLGIVALSFAIDSSQSPLAQDNSTNISITSKVENRDKLSSISDHSLEIGASPLVGTIEDGVYQMNNYSEFYTVSQDGFERVNDQWALGRDMIVAPILSQDDSRTVHLPPGAWRDDLGVLHAGPAAIELKQVPIDRLPYFEKAN